MSPPGRVAALAGLLALGLGAGCSHDGFTGATAVPAESAERSLSRYDFEEFHFGNVPVALTLYARDEEQASSAARAAFRRIAELSAMMTDYTLDPPSPLNRIAVAAPDPVPVPPELLTALARAVEMHGLTGGAFDVTAKPYVQLWRVSQRLGELPPADRLRRAARLVDITALELSPSASTARLAREGMWLDLGGLAKGLIGDEVVRLLRAAGIPRCRYAAGGDMVFGDAPPGREAWTVRVPDFPLDDGGVLTLTAVDEAVSVSGDVFRFVEIDGVRYAHVIDPRTGLGVTERRIACVRGPCGLDTDPLATAGLILEEQAWRDALARVPGCEGWVTRPSGQED